MKTLNVRLEFTVYDALSETSQSAQHLMQEAIKARKKAYAPYSNFHVGVAIKLENGKIITGNNQENASYPSGLCAERTAIYYASAKYPDVKILKMAITATSTKKPTSKPIPPCGACRQAISEYEIKQQQPILIYFMGETGEVIRSDSLSNLLPLMFDKSVL